MITIGKPWIENKGEKSQCICEITIENETKKIWFEVEKKYEKYLSDDRCDAYLIGILNYAMRNNEDITCESPITENLLYNINTLLIPSLSKYAENLYKTKIICETISPYSEGKFIGTGCSGGIDSFDAILSHYNTKYTNMDLTHLCINNVGAFNECYENFGKDKIKESRYREAEIIAKKLNLELIETNSNFQDIYQNHLLTATYSSCFAIYMLQKMWKIYYYASSGIDYSKFNLYKNDLESCAHYDLLSLQAFSIPNLRLYSEGGEKTRLQKTIDISDAEIVKKHLHVCIRDAKNCNICSKCRRTLLSLDLINKLEDYINIFDINYYKQNKKEYYEWLINEHLHKSDMIDPVYYGLKEQKKIPKSIFVKCYFFHYLKKIIPKRIKNKIKELIKKDK